ECSSTPIALQDQPHDSLSSDARLAAACGQADHSSAATCACVEKRANARQDVFLVVVEWWQVNWPTDGQLCISAASDRRGKLDRKAKLLHKDPSLFPTPTFGRRKPPKLKCVSQSAEQRRSVDRQRQPGEVLRIDMFLYGLTGSRGQSSEQGLDVTTNRFQQSELKRLLISNCLSRLV